MTDPEMFELMYASLDYADRNFEFWISASFAVILAYHFSAPRITKLLYRLITFLYCFATVLFISRWLVGALQYASFRETLIEKNATILVSSNFAEAIITVAYVVIIIGGAIGTVYFGHRTMKNSESNEKGL